MRPSRSRSMEEKRRALMFETVNVQKDVPFKIGDVVFDYSLCSTDDPHGAEAVVIGLPSKKALAELCRMRAGLLPAQKLPW